MCASLVARSKVRPWLLSTPKSCVGDDVASTACEMEDSRTRTVDVVVVDAVEDLDRRRVAPVGLVLGLGSIERVQDGRVRGRRLGRGEELLGVAVPRRTLLEHGRVAVAVDDVAAPEERVGAALLQDAPQGLRLVRVGAGADVDARRCRRHGLFEQVRTCSAFCAASTSAAALRGCYEREREHVSHFTRLAATRVRVASFTDLYSASASDSPKIRTAAPGSNLLTFQTSGHTPTDA